MAKIAEPPSKKAKMMDNVDEFIENIVSTENNLSPILSDTYDDPIPLIKCHAGHVKDTRHLSSSIRILNEKLPLTDLQHLKRVRKQYILLCPIDVLTGTNGLSIQAFIEINVPELSDVFDYFKEVDVPSVTPVTKKQHLESCKTWSCNFHPNKYIEKLLSDTCFSQLELQSHRKYMGLAFEVARAYSSQNSTTPSLQDLSSCNLNAAVVVDPTTKLVVTVAFDNRLEHPLQHAAMLAIDNVAKTQNGGAWDTNEKSIKDIISKINERFPNVTFGARKYVGKKDAGENENVNDSPYLCTGYDIYLIREPCIMCAMGLVHARIKRIFYTFENHLHGAVRSKMKLHCVPSLNHRFEVFTGF